MIILPILTTSLILSSLEGWENVFFERLPHTMSNEDVLFGVKGLIAGILLMIKFCSFPGRESFYVTNDHYFGYDSPLFRTLEVLLLNFWLRTDVIYFDGERSHVATSGLKGANGINQDVDER